MSTDATGTVRTVPTPGADYADRINGVRLPERVLDLVEAYEAVGGDRDRFVWKWIYSLFPSFTLSPVPDRHRETVHTQKTVFTLFITLLDDLAERDGDARTFEHVRRTVAGTAPTTERPPGVDAEVAALAERLWTAFEEPLRDAPRHDEFRDVFDYDLTQALNAMEYSRLLNERPELANLNGVRHYDAHNMVLFPYTDVDVMYSPRFDPTDLGVVRELTWDLQQMARIGNWLTTWEREIEEGDYTAGVVVYALQNGLVSREELLDAPDGRETARRRIKEYGVEELFLAEWEHLHRKVEGRDLTADSVDLDAFVEGMETVMEHHLASEGYK